MDKDDCVIGTMRRSEVYAKKIHDVRVVNAFIINSKGELWIPRRAAHKRNYPLCLDMSMGASKLLCSRGKFSEPSSASVKDFPGFCRRRGVPLRGNASRLDAATLNETAIGAQNSFEDGHPREPRHSFFVRRHLIIIQDKLRKVMKNRRQGIGRKPVAMRII